MVAFGTLLAMFFCLHISRLPINLSLSLWPNTQQLPRFPYLCFHDQDMARKWGWFSAVKKVISPADHSKKLYQKNLKLKTTCSAKAADLEPALPSKEEPTFDAPPPLPSIGTDQKEISEEINEEISEEINEEINEEICEEINENIKQTDSVDDATTAAADSQDAATADDTEATEEVVHPTSPPQYLLEKTKEEIAATKIQTAFRGYLARRTLHALRGLMRLKTMMQGDSVKQQAAASLRCMQNLAKVQSQIRERRIRMSEENRSLQRQHQWKHEKEFNKPQTPVGEDWDDSTKSKEEVEARLLDRKEAAMRREKARAYSSVHQQTWKKQAAKTENRTTRMGSMNAGSGWSWSWGERWMGSRPWDEKEAASRARHAQKPSRPPTHHSGPRRHSIAGLSVRDDEDKEGSFSSSPGNKAKFSPSKLFPLSPSASKRHSCPPQIFTFNS